jgi:hypothetical protein
MPNEIKNFESFQVQPTAGLRLDRTLLNLAAVTKHLGFQIKIGSAGAMQGLWRGGWGDGASSQKTKKRLSR